MSDNDFFFNAPEHLKNHNWPAIKYLSLVLSNKDSQSPGVDIKIS